MKALLLASFLLITIHCNCLSQDSTTITVHFIYGSKPKFKYAEEEIKWFGGKHGGHVGVEYDTNKILNFGPMGEFHVVAKKDDFHSIYIVFPEESFYFTFGTPADNVKKGKVTIPVSNEQSLQLKEIARSYQDSVPYDYAFIGMRCASGTYEILAQLGILKHFSNKKTARKIFYPKILRKKLFKLAEECGWNIEIIEGTDRRRWEKN